MNLFSKLKKGLEKTRRGIGERIDQVLLAFGRIDEDLFEELEEILISSDVGIDTSLKIIDGLKSKVRELKITDPARVKTLLKEEIGQMLSTDERGLVLNTTPSVIVVVGVNGVGKTTSIGKIAYNLKQQGKKVMIAAGDTFRAAAIEQLEEWAKRSSAQLIKHREGSDPAAVIYDAIQAAKSRGMDVLICDTAGRLHTKKNLMEELKKIDRVVSTHLPGADRENLLVLDATTGQNAINQAMVFREAANITGLILTKLDGTAKGGIVLAVKSQQDIPVKLIGVGEKIDDLQEFDSFQFVEALFP